MANDEHIIFNPSPAHSLPHRGDFAEWSVCVRPLQDIIEQAPVEVGRFGFGSLPHRNGPMLFLRRSRRDLRLFRPDLVFGVGELGAFLRNQHQNKLLLSYDDGLEIFTL